IFRPEVDVPIRFRCSACNRRLSIATRKAGMQTGCPDCKAVVTVPGPAAPAETAAPAEERGRFLPVAVLAGGALLLVLGATLAVVVAVRKPAQPNAEQVRVDPPANPAPVAPTPVAPAAPTPNPPSPQPGPT